MIFLISLLLSVVMAGCHSDAPVSYQEILGRDRKPYYRIKASGWQRKDVEGSLEDTTKPIAEFLLADTIRATIHNFPGIKIPPSAQIARWQQQIPDAKTHISAQAFSGYVGLKFEGPGVIGWSMQIGPEFPVKGETAADITIKVVGPAETLLAHLEEIERFARSFELIEDL